jgi:hypothetical protein
MCCIDFYNFQGIKISATPQNVLLAIVAIKFRGCVSFLLLCFISSLEVRSRSRQLNTFGIEVNAFNQAYQHTVIYLVKPD